MNNSYHTVNPIIRIKENELLSKDTFEQLIQAPNHILLAIIKKITHFNSSTSLLVAHA